MADQQIDYAKLAQAVADAVKGEIVKAQAEPPGVNWPSIKRHVISGLLAFVGSIGAVFAVVPKETPAPVPVPIVAKVDAPAKAAPSVDEAARVERMQQAIDLLTAKVDQLHRANIPQKVGP